MDQGYNSVEGCLSRLWEAPSLISNIRKKNNTNKCLRSNMVARAYNPLGRTQEAESEGLPQSGIKKLNISKFWVSHGYITRMCLRNNQINFLKV